MTALLLAGALAAGAPTGDWLADFAQLKDELASHDANFEDAVGERRMDLAKLSADTEAQLRAAPDEAEAHAILQKFLKAFGDGHLRVDFPAAGAAAPAADGGTLCARLESEAPKLRDGLPFTQLPNYRALTGADSTHFPAGVLALDGGALGVLRIGLFEEFSYPGACAAVVAQVHPDAAAPCDDGCEDAIQHAAGNPLLRQLERQVAALEAAGAQTLLIDLTGNGGGTEWDDAVALTLSPRPPVQPRALFLKHPHWTRQFERALAKVRADEADARTGAALLPLLRDAERRLAADLAVSKQTCDRRPLWRDQPIHCSALASAGFTSGLYARPGHVSLAGLRSTQVLFEPLIYDVHPHANPLPVVLAVDRGTGSAAERFAAELIDTGAVRSVGELTAGAGCGYTEGGIKTVLTHTGGVVKMPDCVALRADGTNSERGLIPDVLVPWGAQDSPWQKLEKLLPALQKVLEAR